MATKKPSKDKKPAQPKKLVNGKEPVTWEELIMNFSIDKLGRMNTMQMAVSLAVTLVAVLAIYSYLFAVPATTEEYVGLNAVLEKPQVETAEEKFKRENKNVSLPDGSKVPPDIVDENTHVETQIPFGDKTMEYVVRMPNSWATSNFALYGLPGEEDYTILTNIARYFGPAIEDARPFFWLEVQKLKRYITAEAFTRAFMLNRGIAPQALVVKSENEAEALYVDVRDLRSYAMRTTFKIEGHYMLMSSVGVPIESYSDYKDMMGLILNSFDLVNPPEGQIEEILDYKLLNVLRFRYYASWLPKNEFAQTAIRPSVELHNPQEVNNPNGDLLQGIILVNAWRLSAAFDEKAPMQEIKDRLQGLSMVLQDDEVQPTQDLPIRDSFVSIKQTLHMALVNRYIRKDDFDIIKSEETKTRQEVWITVVDNGYYRNYLTLITPLKDTNYIIWARNMAAYELLIKSLQARTAPKEEESDEESQ